MSTVHAAVKSCMRENDTLKVMSFQLEKLYLFSHKYALQG
jgi:hypothetical protein